MALQLRLENKKTFISGSTAGIGFGIAKHLALAGAEVILNGRTQKTVDLAVEKLRSIRPNTSVSGLVCDFSNPKEIERLIPYLQNVELLINNVGIYQSENFFTTKDTSWNRQWEVNVMSGVRLSRALLPNMLQNNKGRILFISSECAFLVPKDLIAYSVTKAALLSLSRALAEQTKGTAVTVNTVLPGSTMTEGALDFIQQKATQNKSSIAKTEKDFFAQERSSSLLQRFATVDEVAQTAVYLLSPIAAAINGTVLKVDGGSVKTFF